ncbi:MAG: acyl-CoA dehydrogenase family protein [Phenylobacterium sp.]|uniref:acyl-CoA dehydrogenase family protein n=1 Tax=Phenylobacterium sp. TaxID=1871053 RepID=UPI002717DED1|nr:acyl-CoA dehydrogenase family protein [Phenylobacterium sp.]MDO8913379.1 acyl-CoA dehydrogenase family protein [Phenylobacterium sp.]MDP3101224.1 acyl-CoA dehydrogenase family protein [Phenylobacterium sp.]
MADDAAAPVTDDGLREEVRAFLENQWTGLLQGETERKAWFAKVVEARWAVPRWPTEWMGRGLGDVQARIVESEFAAAGATGTGQDRTNLWANTLLAGGTQELKERLLLPLLRGEVGMCLLYSEPGAGSDLAGIRTRADRQIDHFLINGQKVWTSYAATADYGMLIARTDWDVPKHRGISFFFLPMKQPGVEVRPLRQITNESQFNEVFLTDAICPEENLLGELGQGWGVLQTALAYERSVMGEGARGPRSGVAESKNEEPLIALAREAGALSDPLIRQEISKVIGLKKLNALNTARAKAEMKQGTSSALMSLGKLAMSRILHEEARVRTMILGAGSLLEGPDFPRAEDANFLTLNAYFTSIGGGTDQIQRNIIGERVLGLPKEPEVDRDIPFRDVRSG